MDENMDNYPMGPTQPWETAMGGEVPEGIVGRAGAPLDDGVSVAGLSAVAEALRTVYDPEIPVNIYELGLIYTIDIGEETGNAMIEMTLTAPGCPVAGILPQQVADAAASVPGIAEVEVKLVWDPPWDMDKMSDEAKVALGMF